MCIRDREKIQVLNGRYGPYITDGAKNARVPKGSDPKALTLAECQALLAAAPLKGTRGRFGRRFPAKGGKAAKTPEATAGTGAEDTGGASGAARKSKGTGAPKKAAPVKPTARKPAAAKSGKPASGVKGANGTAKSPSAAPVKPTARKKPATRPIP